MGDRRPWLILGIGQWFLLGVFTLMTAAWIEYAWELLTAPGGLRSLSSVEFWAPLPFVVIPLLLLWQPARRRPPRGCCLNCGYNLTGNVSGACPECGTPRRTRKDAV